MKLSKKRISRALKDLNSGQIAILLLACMSEGDKRARTINLKDEFLIPGETDPIQEDLLSTLFSGEIPVMLPVLIASLGSKRYNILFDPMSSPTLQVARERNTKILIYRSDSVICDPSKTTLKKEGDNIRATTPLGPVEFPADGSEPIVKSLIELGATWEKIS